MSATSKRISELAKELGVESKAIVAKCHAEGISPDVVKGHMSRVGAGLEQSIREWFSGGGVQTVVETSDKVDITSVRAKPTRGRKKAVQAEPKDADSPSQPADAGMNGTAVEMPAAPAIEAPPAEPAVEHPIEAEHAVGATATMPEVAQPVAKAPEPKTAEPVTETKPPTPPTGTAGHPGAAKPSRPAPATPSAQMNVPRRPTTVAPAGPKLENRAPVKLSGPKVVRIEAPEPVEQPRRRQGPPVGVGGAGAGTRPVGRGTEGDDDRSRSPRRRSSGGGGGGGGAPQKRSSGAGVPERRRAFATKTDWVGGPGVFSEQDMIEREARLLRAGGFLKKRRQDASKRGGIAQQSQDSGVVEIAAPFTIKDLSAATGVKGSDIIKKLFLQGVMAKINDGIDPAKAQEIMMEFDIDLRVVEAKTAEEVVSAEFVDRAEVDVRSRGPVVTILGHVDHGKTSLLDKIRKANVAAGEAGGITQKTSAFRVPIEINGEQKEIVFFDTPGHEAFTSMRSRGANLTDVVVLVVSAPEGVMPQTIESINHAKAAKVPIVIALNKIDRQDATEAAIQRTLGQLAAAGCNPLEWGGDTEVVRVSATTGQGIPQLLEVLDLQAQILELKADFGGNARGAVIEAKVEEGRGPVASMLVQQGRLNVGDFIVIGRAYGRIRDISDDNGKKLKVAYPPMPVQVSGLSELPDAGDKFYVVDSLRKAQDAAEQRSRREREAELATPKVTLDALFTQMSEKSVKEILVVLKADLQGTVDVLKSQCEKVSTDEVKVRVLHGAVGGINESDVLLADASRAVIIGFNVIPSGKARPLAEQKGIEIRTYQVIYDITDDLRKAAEGMLKPEIREEVLGHAEVRKVFKVSKVGAIAGCYITDGIVQRDALIRVTRGGVVIEHDRTLEQLKRFKDDAKDVRAGMECGMKIVGYDDIKEGDVLECYKKVEVKRTLGS